MAERKIAYATYPGPGPDATRVIIVEEGVSGYRFVPDYDCSPASHRAGIARRLNKRLGITPKEVERLLSQSFADHPRGVRT